MTSSWKNSYSIGLHVIDGQHKRLIAYFDELKEEMKQGVSQDTKQITLNNLKIYANNHFALEEKFMEQTDYPYSMSHRAEHLFFIKKITEFESKLSVANNVICIEMLQFLNTWILTHIKTTDNKMMPFLIDNGVNNLNCYETAEKDLLHP